VSTYCRVECDVQSDGVAADIHGPAHPSLERVACTSCKKECNRTCSDGPPCRSEGTIVAIDALIMAIDTFRGARSGDSSPSLTKAHATSLAVPTDSGLSGSRMRPQVQATSVASWTGAERQCQPIGLRGHQDHTS